jgi:predicted dienelactone hydrolase
LRLCRLRAVASVVVLAVAACAVPRPGPDAVAAGETWRTAASASAAARSGGDATLRIVVWYPASRAADEATVTVGAPDRPVFVTGRVARDAPWADKGPHPVIVASHGYGGAARQLTWLGSALARAGYVVIAVDHPGTNGVDGITAEGTYAAWERALDLRIALDAVARDPELGPRLDLSRVGAAGFSLGGWTAALLAGARTDFAAFDRFCAGPARDSICEPQREYPADFTRRHPTLAQPAMRELAAREHADHRDPRVRAAFLIAPALAQALDPASLASIRVPVAVLVGSADPITRAATNANVIATSVPGATLVTLPGVAHYDFLSECGAEGRRVAEAYCTDGAGTRRGDTHATTIAAARRFFDAMLR